MAQETDLVSMAQAFTGLPMNDLIGAPLMAAAEANNQMAMTQVRYILETGFYPKTDDSGELVEPVVYEPVMLQMELTQPFIQQGVDPETGLPDPALTTIDDITTTINVPLLTVMPVNALAVDEVEVTFEMEVKSSYAQEKTLETQEKLAAEASFEAKVGYGPFSASITGSVAYSQESRSAESEKYEKSNSARYYVRVHAAQQGQPPGLALILEQFAKNIGPYTLGEETSGGESEGLAIGGEGAGALPGPDSGTEILVAGGGQPALVGTARVTR